MPIKALYIHVPFCKHICAYCDFMRVGYHPKLVADYLKALKLDKENHDLSQVDTVYFGGGTPSALSLEELRDLFKLFSTEMKQAKEVTIEVNPETLDVGKVQLFKECGINRISLGVQSFKASELSEMERFHTVSDVDTALDSLRSFGLENISLDLMYGLPHQTEDSLRFSLSEVFKRKVPHFSIYALTLEEHSTWGRQHREACESDLEASFYELIQVHAQDAGYQAYEVSNFTQNRPSLHNLHYWHYDDYLGLGPGSSSKIGMERWDASRNLQHYVSSPKERQITPLSRDDEAFERIMMGLRVDDGIDLERFKQSTGFDLLDHYKEAWMKHQNLGHLVIQSNHLKTTKQGRAVLHDVLIDFMLD